MEDNDEATRIYIARLECENEELRKKVDYLEELWVEQEQEIFKLTCGFDPKVKMPKDYELVLVQLASSATTKLFGMTATLESAVPAERIRKAFWNSRLNGWTVDIGIIYGTEFIEHWWEQQTWDL